MSTNAVSRWWLSGCDVWGDGVEGPYPSPEPPWKPGVVVGDVGLYLQFIEEARPPNPLLVKQLRKLSAWPEREKQISDLFDELKGT